MVGLYLDASVIVASFVQQADSVAVDLLIGQTDRPLYVSSFAYGETVSAFSRLARLRELEHDQAVAMLHQLDQWRRDASVDRTFDANDIQLAIEFVRRFDLALRLPDAIHASLCRRNGLTLVTLDRRLASAARALQIDVVVPV